MSADDRITHDTGLQMGTSVKILDVELFRTISTNSFRVCWYLLRYSEVNLAVALVHIQGLLTPSDYVTVTVTLTGSTFRLGKQIKGTTRQCYGDCYVIAQCEQTFTVTFFQEPESQLLRLFQLLFYPLILF